VRVRTPLTGAERALEDTAYLVQARHRGRDPERLPGWGVLTWDGPLPTNHPLADTPAEARAKRVAQEKQRRAPARDPWW